MSLSPPLFDPPLARLISSLRLARPPVAGAELSRFTSFAIGGPARCLLLPADRAEAAAAAGRLAAEKIPFRVLGAGSNLLVDDGGVSEVVIRLAPPFSDLRFRGRRLVASAGAFLPAVARAAAERGLSGLEFGAGIPGTLGGAVATNAGCEGEDASRVVKRVRAFFPGEGMATLSREECGFGYRRSDFLSRRGVIVEVECELSPARPFAVRERMERILSERKRKFPLGIPSAGSVFKNPPGDHAGRLIEAAGLKGERRGDAQISTKHANWIVNLGRARSAEVEELIAAARSAVRRRFGRDLELEIEIWK